MINNNSTSIINNWKRLYEVTKSPYFARCVFQATGELPDGLDSVGFDMTEPRSQEDTEMKNIIESINNKELSTIPY